MGGGQTWTSDECAKAWGVKTPTWLGYVARGQAPEPLPGLRRPAPPAVGSRPGARLPPARGRS